MTNLVKLSVEEENKILKKLLINLHTARWTGNYEMVENLLNKIGQFSYARTNSFEESSEETEQREIQTLLNLDTLL